MFEYRPVGNHLNDFALIRGGDEWHLFHVIGRWQKGRVPVRYECEDGRKEERNLNAPASPASGVGTDR